MKAEGYCFAGGSVGGKCYDMSTSRCCTSGTHSTLCPHSTTCRALVGLVECVDQAVEPLIPCNSTSQPTLGCGADEQCLTVKDPLDEAAPPSHSYCCPAQDSLCSAVGKVRSVDGGVCMLQGASLRCCQNEEQGLWAVCETEQKCGVESGRMLCQISTSPPAPSPSPSEKNNTVLFVIISVVIIGLVIALVAMYRRRKRDQTSSYKLQAGLLDDNDLDDSIYHLDS